MTELVQRESRVQLDEGQSSQPPAGGQPTKSRLGWLPFQYLRRCFSFLGFAIVIVTLSATLLELLSWAIWSIHPLSREAELENQGASPVYAGVDWAREFWREEFLRRQQLKNYVPFRIWGVTEWHSQFINNDHGATGILRRTINPASCDRVQPTTVWTFGGSTMYGTAVPDFATIPSYLSRDLNSGSPDCVVVVNFGAEGYVTDQELILLQEQLKAGGRPDIVVFYDGVNDSSLAWAAPGHANPHFSFAMLKNRVEGSLSGRLDFLQKSYAVRLTRAALARLQPPGSFASLVATEQPNIIATFRNYEGNLRIARALSDAYKFKLYCFWQPMLTYGHKPLVQFEEKMAARDATATSPDSAWFLTMNAVYREAEQHASTDGVYVFLGGLFDSIQEPLYVDEAHLGPRGNEIVAQAIADHIRTHPGGWTHAQGSSSSVPGSKCGAG
jgi:lysophospholipase L1-like esterase